MSFWLRVGSNSYFGNFLRSDDEIFGFSDVGLALGLLLRG